MPLIALEIVLGFVVPIGWGGWELLSLRRERQRDAAKAAIPEAMGTSPVAPPCEAAAAPPGSPAHGTEPSA